MKNLSGTFDVLLLDGPVPEDLGHFALPGDPGAVGVGGYVGVHAVLG